MIIFSGLVYIFVYIPQTEDIEIIWFNSQILPRILCTFCRLYFSIEYHRIWKVKILFLSINFTLLHL